jgi:DNA repair exonuclease SbcCD ATPase subunit
MEGINSQYFEKVIAGERENLAAIEKLLTQKINGIREMMDQRKEFLMQMIRERIEGHERAVEKAERALDSRLKGMNEFRDQLTAQANLLATREQVDLMVGDVQRRLNELEKSRATMASEMSSMSQMGTLIASCSTRINELERSRATIQAELGVIKQVEAVQGTNVNRITNLEQSRANLQGRLAMGGVILGVCLVLMQIGMHIALKFAG